MHTRGARTDVFVIGGGPAGLAAAIAARRKGFAVTVADGSEPPIDKACGEGLMPETQAALALLGVKLPGGSGLQFRGIRFLDSDTEATADFPDGQGIGIRRTRLHEILISEAENCGVNLLWGTPVVGIANHGVYLNEGTVQAQWIIGADGGHSRVRQWCDLNSGVTASHRVASRRHYRVRPWTEYMEIYWAERIQAYVTAVSHEEVCIVTLGETPETADFDHVLNLLPVLRERLSGAELASRERGAVTAMQLLARVWQGSVALVGDASGGVDAITGEGLRLAFQQSQALAEAMQAGDLRLYGRAHKKLSRRPLWMGKLMLQFGQYGEMRSRAMKILRRNPELFQRLLAIHVGRSTTKATLSTGLELGWQFLAS
ncbi:MAG: FAD-dependent monooxygenase [Candidatus Acidiferrum sp.]